MRVIAVMRDLNVLMATRIIGLTPAQGKPITQLRSHNRCTHLNLSDAMTFSDSRDVQNSGHWQSRISSMAFQSRLTDLWIAWSSIRESSGRAAMAAGPIAPS